MGDSTHGANGDGKKEGSGALLKSDSNPEKQNYADNLCSWRCGSKCNVACGCLQPLATAKWTLALLAITNLLRQTVLNGLCAVTISTLEKRFELRSTESGLIASMGDFGLGVCLLIIMFLPSRIDKPVIIGWSLAVTGLAMIATAVPHFTAPVYVPLLGDVLNYCGNVTEPDCHQSMLRNYLYWFLACFCVMGAATCPFVVYSVTYLDENVKKNVSTLYNAIYMSFGGLGPVVGFVFGGMTLEFYTYVMADPSNLNIDSSSYSWVGAWWLGYMVFGILLILVTTLIVILPKHLPGTEKHREGRDGETQRSHLTSSAANDRSSGALGTFSEILYLVQNKPYILMVFGITMNCGLIYGFNTFGAKYLETVFGLKPFHASVLYGLCGIVASFGAQIVSGVVVKKFNLQVAGILKYMIGVGIMSAICSIGLLVHCDNIDFAGGTVPYPGTEDSQSLISSCNSNCGCSTDRFEPVCAGGMTYYSPCFAGCGVQLNDTSFTNCSCVTGNVSHVNLDIVVSSESCDRNPCSMIIVFAFVVSLCFFSSVLTLPTSMQVILRCVPFDKRDMAISFQFAIRHLVGVVPGRLLVGYVLDKACVAWSTECGHLGSCKVYDRWDIAKYNTILLISQTVVCVITYILVFVTYKPVGNSNPSATAQIELQPISEKRHEESVWVMQSQDQSNEKMQPNV